ncbi:MAG: hypothetical protein LW832_00470 [Parachlamydia sp.]|jgi:hypothetical protein|nr:hypothetical protein [Parachlamydia sp.]
MKIEKLSFVANAPIQLDEEEKNDQPDLKIEEKATSQPSPLHLFTLQQTPKFPKSLEQLTVVNAYIGGSTGAKLVQDRSGRKFVLKAAGENHKIKQEHLEREYATTQAYQALGVNVPDQQLYPLNETESKKLGALTRGASLIMLSAYLPGQTVELKDYMEEGTLEELRALVQKDFVADCLLANWDVIGLEFDNIRIDVDSKKIWRVDNGSGLDYRAQGAKKGAAFSKNVVELHTFCDSDINYQSALLFSNISKEQIQEQIKNIMMRKDDLLAAIPLDLRETMEGRLDYLKDYLHT